MLALIAMMLVVVCDVALRFAFRWPLPGAYDLVEVSLTVFVFFGMPTVIARGQDIVIDLIDGFVPAGTARFLSAIAGVLAAATLIFIFWSMLRPATDAYRYGDVRLQLNLPVWIVWALALLGLAGSILAALSVLIRRQVLEGEPLRHEEAVFE